MNSAIVKGLKVLAKPNGDPYHYMAHFQAASRASTIPGARAHQFVGGRAFYVVLP